MISTAQRAEWRTLKEFWREDRKDGGKRRARSGSFDSMVLPRGNIIWRGGARHSAGEDARRTPITGL